MKRDERSDRRRMRQYVTVILEMASAAGSWQAWDRDLQLLSRLAASGPARTLLARPQSTSAQRNANLSKLCGDLVSPDGLAIAEILLDEAIFDLLPAVWAQYRRRSEQQGPVDRVTVTSAVALGEGDLRELQAKVQRPGRWLLIDFVVDPEILGGLVVRKGDWRTDLSVRARLGAVQAALQ